MLLKIKMLRVNGCERCCTTYYRKLPRREHLSWVVKVKQTQETGRQGDDLQKTWHVQEM